MNKWTMAALTAALVSLTACSTNGAEHTPGVTPSATRWAPSSETLETASTSASTPEGSDPELPTPLRPYMYTVTESATMLYAQSVVLADCVRPFGFEYPIKPYADVLANERAQAEDLFSSLFGPTDKSMAEKYGYGIAPSAPLTSQEEILADDPNFTLVLFGTDRSSAPGEPSEGTADPSDTTAEPSGTPLELDGLQVPSGGCFGEANRRLDGVQELNMGDRTRAMWVQASEDVKSEPDYQAVVVEWRGCMHQAGFEVTSPLSDPAVNQLVRERPDPNVPTAEEVAMALADVDCKTETDLVARLSRVTWQFEERLVEQNQLALQENRAKLDGQLELAIDEIEQAGGFQ